MLLLESEIIAAYYFQRGVIEHSLSWDKQVIEALRLIQSSEEYQKILHP